MNSKSESGFSYIDVVVALLILMVGILGLLSGISSSILQTRSHEQQLQAKQIATSTMESIMSVKETDTARLGWMAVGNVGSNPNAANVPQGIFLVGFQPVYSNAGIDEVLGTGDDTGATLTGFQRRIVITDICDPDRPSYNCSPPGLAAVRMRTVSVTVRYNIGGLQRDEVLNTVLTNYQLN